MTVSQEEKVGDEAEQQQGVEKQGAEGIEIFLRIKPSKASSGFFDWEDDQNVFQYNLPKNVASGLVNNTKTNYKFKFDSVIGMESSQEEVFEAIGKPVRDQSWIGETWCMLTYVYCLYSVSTMPWQDTTVLSLPMAKRVQVITIMTMNYVYESRI